MTNQILTRGKYFILSLVLFTIKSSAQDISGIYSGTLVNDSLKMVQNYELALSEYRGKITGYSYITFIANDTFYYGIKRVKASRQNGELVVEDVEMLANNYPKRPDKGVHVINRIPMPPGQDTILDMNGRWETTATKKFYSISGLLSLRRNEDSTESPLIAHLTELKEINYQDEKKNLKNIAKTEVKQKPKEEKRQPKDIAYVETRPKEIRPSAAETKPKEIQPREIISNPIVSSEKKTTESKPGSVQATIATQQNATKPTSSNTNQIATSEKKAPENKPLTANSNNTTEQNKAVTVSTIQKSSSESSKISIISSTPPKERDVAQQAVVKQTPSANSNTQQKETKPVAPQPTIVTEQSRANNTKVTVEKTNTMTSDEVKIAAAPSAIAERASNTIQTLTVVSDSLVLSFYDNGVVDGDSISVYLNNENIISSVKLKEAAVKKTIYINGRTDDMKLTLVADNLGSIPPNTGLLIIQDGNDRYQIRFSADLQTNASVILRKKR